MPNELADAVMALKTQKNTWRDVGNLLGVNRSLAWQVAHGKCDSPKVRHALGLPAKMIAVAPCAVCGEVHVKKTCVKKHRDEFRRAATFKTRKRALLFDEMMKEHGESLTNLMNSKLDRWLETKQQ